MELEEGSGDRLGSRCIHREDLARPVERAPQTSELLGDACAIRLLPLPHLGREGLTSKLVAGDLIGVGLGVGLGGG